MPPSCLQVGEDDQDSLFGSPPPSPARGRSPAVTSFFLGEETSPDAATSSMGTGTGASGKNVGTIALPGSHMSCSELPANLPAARLSLPCHASGPGPLSVPPHSKGEILATVSTTEAASPPRSRSSRADSVLSVSRPSTPGSAFTVTPLAKKRRSSKAKSSTPAPVAPPIPLPGPHEPTPPNFLRSQSALLGLAGLVGSVKPAQLHSHERGPTYVQPSRLAPLPRGSTPTNPIVLDEDEDAPRIGQQPAASQAHFPSPPEQIDPEKLRGNVLVSLAEQKNIVPVLESLIKLLGGIPHVAPPSNSPHEPFARPYGHGIFDSPRSASAPLDISNCRAPPVPPPKRRKLRHVPAGAADWDIPFPFAAGEGPEAYHNTWARERGKQLVTQLLGLVKGAVEKATVKMARSTQRGRGRPPKLRGNGLQTHQSSRSTSVDTQTGQSGRTDSATCDTTENTDGAVLPKYGTSSTAIPTGNPAFPLNHFLASLYASGTTESSSLQGSSDGWCTPSGDVEGSTALQESGSRQESVPFDHAAFEEWLAQLQAFVPPESDAPSPDWEPSMFRSLDFDAPRMDVDTPPPYADESSAPGAGEATYTIPDDAIDPTLLAISFHPATSIPPRSQLSVPGPTPPSTLLQSVNQSQGSMIAISPPPALAYSPRTSLSSFTEPTTPCSDTFGDSVTTMIINSGDYDHDTSPATSQVADITAKLPNTRPQTRAQTRTRVTPATATSQPPHSRPQRLTAAQKGKEKAIASVVPRTTSAPIKRTPATGTETNVALARNNILELARERRRQIIAEIERAKVELWETSIEGGVLVHLVRDSSL